MSYFSFAQDDKTDNTLVLKIAKPYSDTVFIKADIAFTQFEDADRMPAIVNSNSQIYSPVPNLKGQSSVEVFNFLNCLKGQYKIISDDLNEKTIDTVVIEILVLSCGKPYYTDASPLVQLGGVPAYFDKKNNRYVLDQVHWKCYSALRQIENWRPAYVEIVKVARFKGQKVLKPKYYNVNAKGRLTVVVSRKPIGFK